MALTVSAFAACCRGTFTMSGDGSWKFSGSVCAMRSSCNQPEHFSVPRKHDIPPRLYPFKAFCKELHKHALL